MTQALVLEDWASPFWRLNNLYRIIDADGEDVPFHMNQEQEHFYRGLWYWNLILKARQLGFTTEIVLLALDQAMFNRNFSAAIIAHKKDDATKIFEKKLKYAYDRLPEALRVYRAAERSPAGELWLNNGSNVVVDTSARSGTIQLLHISEFGKICAERPDVANEIVTGSLPAVKPGNFVIIESTAEGNEGKFYDYCMSAKQKADSNAPMTRLDFKLHFYPWYTRAANVLPEDEAVGVELSEKDLRYFHMVEAKCRIGLSHGQRAWYVKTRDVLGDLMQREHPSYMEEAFEAAIEGLIYGHELTLMRKNDQVTNVPWIPGIPVNTFWDFGVSKGNATCIWFHQRVGMRNNLIRYYEREGEGLAHFANEIKSHGYTMGQHFLPHDADQRLEGEMIETRADILRGLVAGDVIVGDRIRDVNDGIEMTRQFLPSCWIDRTACKEGLKGLDNYRREYDAKLKQSRRAPLHNWASNPADALRTGAQTYRPRIGSTVLKRHRQNWRS